MAWRSLIISWFKYVQTCLVLCRTPSCSILFDQSMNVGRLLLSIAVLSGLISYCPGFHSLRTSPFIGVLTPVLSSFCVLGQKSWLENCVLLIWQHLSGRRHHLFIISQWKIAGRNKEIKTPAYFPIQSIPMWSGSVTWEASSQKKHVVIQVLGTARAISEVKSWKALLEQKWNSFLYNLCQQNTILNSYANLQGQCHICQSMLNNARQTRHWNAHNRSRRRNTCAHMRTALYSSKNIFSPHNKEGRQSPGQ